MKKIQLVALALLFACMVFQKAALAKTMEGNVVMLDGVNNKLQILKADPETNVEKKSSVLLDAKTAFVGVKDLKGLMLGQTVQIEAEKDPVTGKYKATKVVKV